jgi:hypothetical protein
VLEPATEVKMNNKGKVVSQGERTGNRP